MFPTDHALLNLLYEDFPLYVRSHSNKKATAEACLTPFPLLTHLFAVPCAMDKSRRASPNERAGIVLT